MDRQTLKLVAKLKRQAAAAAIDSPARISIIRIGDVFERGENAHLLIEGETAPDVRRRIAWQRGEKRNNRVVVDDKHAVDRRPDRQQTALQLCKRLTRQYQDPPIRSARPTDRRRQSVYARASSKIISYLRSGTRR